MPSNDQLAVRTLSLDLSNYRTVKQPDENNAVHAMITISPDRFWALLESLMDDGYHPTENIIVQKGNKGLLLVREGNRRIAALKIAHGFIKNIDVPPHLHDGINQLSTEWKKANKTVPCAVYSSSETDVVDKLVALTHAKGEKAARDIWNAVARARYERDKKGASTPGLDLLEEYLRSGKNRTPEQAARWAGDYPLTVLVEAIQKIAPLLGFPSIKKLVLAYPKQNKRCLDAILLHIGISHLGFKEVRDGKDFFGIEYGIEAPAKSSGESGSTSSTKSSQTQTQTSSTSHQKTKTTAVSINDPRIVKRKLRGFQVKGTGRDKIVALREEMRKLKIKDHPHAFCFLLRSMFELSAKAYCADHKPAIKTINKQGNDRRLAEILKDIVKHMTQNGKDKDKQKLLHGAGTELAKSEGILSVTSMNQLIHNPSFSIQAHDICILFSNVFPLLEEMNK